MLPTKFRFIWPSGFRKEDFFKSANQKQELPRAAMFVNGSGQNEQSLERTFHRCFLPSFTSFGRGVLEEKFKMWKVNGQTTDAKWWQKLKLPLARWGKKLSGISKILLKELFFFNYNISVPQLPLYNAQKFTKVPYFARRVRIIRVCKMCQSCQTWLPKFVQILPRTDTRLVFCNRN